MKKESLIISLLMMAFLFYYEMPATAQTDSLEYFTITGVVKDARSKKELSSVNVFLPGTHIGTVTNEEGRFSFKLKKMVSAIKVSYLGYRSQKLELNKNNVKDLKIMLVPHTNMLNEIVVLGLNPKKIIMDALDNVENSYCKKKNNLTGFYRETAQKGKKFINVSEAILNIYKTPYSESINRDRVQILKGRRLLSQKSSDTLGVKLMGGPTLCVFADIAKDRESFLSKQKLDNYVFIMDESTTLDSRPQYVISFFPRIELPDEALFMGKVYIDKENMTFTRIEFSLDMTSKYKATKAMLYKKPLGLRFKPLQLSYIVSYKTENGVAYLNYLRNEISFKCDWKRRLFSKSFDIISEMVVTDQNDTHVIPISYRNSFDSDDTFYDKALSFEDDNFWEDYNIIEPTESLEHAVNKLKKQQK